MDEKKNEVFKGYAQLQAIIGEIMQTQEALVNGRGCPRWDFLNGVLSCEKVLGDSQLWFHWGRLLIVTKADREAEKRAGEMEELDDWNTEEDGTITLIGKKQKED